MDLAQLVARQETDNRHSANLKMVKARAERKVNLAKVNLGKVNQGKDNRRKAKANKVRYNLTKVNRARVSKASCKISLKVNLRVSPLVRAKIKVQLSKRPMANNLVRKTPPQALPALKTRVVMLWRKRNLSPSRLGLWSGLEIHAAKEREAVAKPARLIS